MRRLRLCLQVCCSCTPLISLCSPEGNRSTTIRVKGSHPDDAHQTKTVHFVRHGEGYHNVAGAIDPKNYLKEEYADSALTEKGTQQCINLHNVSRVKSEIKTADLIVVSPLRRALETATLSFPQLISRDGKPLIKWVAVEEIREVTGAHPCDRRSQISIISKDFAHVDFTNITEDTDPLYSLYTEREPDAHVEERARAFLLWLASREEKNVIIVTHSAFLRVLFNRVLDVSLADRVWYENCELRSYNMELPQNRK